MSGPIQDRKRSLKLLRVATRIDFSAHDLRRTVASHMTGMGIARLTVSKVLNHAESSVTSVYDRHSYDLEKREALEAWGRAMFRIGERAAQVSS
jgi:integrase